MSSGSTRRSRSPAWTVDPATAHEMEWLLRRSMGIGLPAPADLSPLSDGTWRPDDLHSFADQVEYETEPLGRTVKLTSRQAGEPVERHVAVMSVGRLEEIEAPDPGHEPWLSHTDRLPFPVEWSCQFDVLTGVDARKAIQRKLLVVRDMQRHFAEHDLDEPLALDRQARQAREVEDQMTRGVDVAAARVHGWFRVAVAGRTREECLERVRKVTTSYRSRRVTIEHPRGQFGLLREFIPAEPVSTSAYRRRLPALYVAAGLPMASSRLGDRRGPYVGFTAGSSRRAVMFDTHYATEVKETSGLVPVVGGLGAGKSVLLGQITYEAVRRGIPSVILDPSGPLARLTELPELREHSEHLDLTTAASGTLNPFEVVAAPLRSAYPTDDAFAEAEVLAAQDRKLLAMDVVKMLLPASVDSLPETSLVISDAVRATRGERQASLWDVVRNLEGLDSPHGRIVANYLSDMAELPLSRLFFPRAAGRRHSPGRPADRADHAGPGPASAVRAAGPLVDVGAARRAPPAPGLLVRHPCRLRPGDAEPQAGRARRDALPRGVVGGPCSVHEARARLPEVEHLRAGCVTEPVRRAGHGRRQLHVRRVRGAHRGRGRCPRRTADAAGRNRSGLRTGARHTVLRPGRGGFARVRHARRGRPRGQAAGGPDGQPGPARGAEHHRRAAPVGRGPGAGGMRRQVLRVAAMLALLVVIGAVLPSTASAVPGFDDCKDAPTPEVPGRGISGFFAQPPAGPPQQADPFKAGSGTTIYEQYGYAGLRWHTYDLGCGPDAMRAPDAVIGTAMSNWVMQAPIALTALTGSLTQSAFEPTFLSSFDGVIIRVSTALHESLFVSWIPAVIAVLGALIIFKARRSSLATTAAAIGWAMIVILLTTALFRWPVEAGEAADSTVTGTMGTVVSKLDGNGSDVDPGTAVASNVSESIFYRAWLAGTLGSPDSETAQKYGPRLFKDQALTWREAAILESDPDKGNDIIEAEEERLEGRRRPDQARRTRRPTST